MWQKCLTMILVTIFVSWPVPVCSQVSQELRLSGFKFRFQANPVDPINICNDSPSVKNKFVEGELEIIFSESQQFAQGERHFRNKYTLRLPLKTLSKDGSVEYRDSFKVILYRFPVPKDFEAIFVGTVSKSGFNFDVKYRVKDSNDCWKQRYLRSPANTS